MAFSSIFLRKVFNLSLLFSSILPSASGGRFVLKRHSTPNSTVLVLASAFFFSSSSSLHLRLIKIMSLNRTKSDNQSAAGMTSEKTVMSGELSNQNEVVGHHRPPIALYGSRAVTFFSAKKGSPCVFTAHVWAFFLINNLPAISRVNNIGNTDCDWTAVHRVPHHTMPHVTKKITVQYTRVGQQPVLLYIQLCIPLTESWT